MENIYLATPSFLTVFDFELLEGDAKTVLSELNQVLITPEFSKKYFGIEAALGDVLDIQVGDDWQQFQIGGIINKAPGNSSFQFDIILPFEITKTFVSERARNSWTNVFPENYILLKEDIAIEDLEAKVAPFIDQQVAKIYKPGEYVVGFQPLEDIHLNNAFPVGMISVSDWRYPYILSVIAILILLLAGINFVSLAIGRSVSRAKEVGVRKVSGATRIQLMQQFWSEAIVLTLIAVVIGVFICRICTPLLQ